MNIRKMKTNVQINKYGHNGEFQEILISFEVRKDIAEHISNFYNPENVPALRNIDGKELNWTYPIDDRGYEICLQEAWDVVNDMLNVMASTELIDCDYDNQIR